MEPPNPEPADRFHAVLAVEQRLGLALPGEYAEAMTVHNGGELPTEHDLWELYPLPDLPARQAGHNAYGDLVAENLACRDRSGFPAGALSIADNGLGDQLVFLPRPGGGGLAPELWFWHHESGQLEWVADAFSDLERVA
jgi:hypothetical protein